MQFNGNNSVPSGKIHAFKIVINSQNLRKKRHKYFQLITCYFQSDVPSYMKQITKTNSTSPLLTFIIINGECHVWKHIEWAL